MAKHHSPIHIKHSGPVDPVDNYPVFVRTSNSDNNDTKEQSHTPRPRLAVGKSNQLENQAMDYYGLLDADKPYFDMDEDDSGRKIWVSGSTLATLEEAQSSLIGDDLSRQLQIGDEIVFMIRLDATRLSCIHCQKKTTSTDDQVQQGRGVVTRVITTSRLNKALEVSCGGNISHMLRIDQYRISRTKHSALVSRDSNLALLFEVRVTAEHDLMAQMLKQILVEHDWITVNAIASYLPLHYQRNVYLDATNFESLVSEGLFYDDRYHPSNSVRLRMCAECSALTPTGPCASCKSKCRCEYCSAGGYHRSHRDHGGYAPGRRWPPFNCQFEKDSLRNTNAYYEERILALSRRNNTFSSHQLLELYAKGPRLQTVCEADSKHLSRIQGRLDIAMTPRTKLHGYQLQTVLWAHNIERAVLEEQRFCIGSNDMRFTGDPSVDCAVYVVREEDRFAITNKSKWYPLGCIDRSRGYHIVPSGIPKIIKPRLFSFRGGIIADEAGLGKSLTLLSLVAAHPLHDDATSCAYDRNTDQIEAGPRQTARCGATLIVAPSVCFFCQKVQGHVFVCKEFDSKMEGRNRHAFQGARAQRTHDHLVGGTPPSLLPTRPRS